QAPGKGRHDANRLPDRREGAGAQADLPGGPREQGSGRRQLEGVPGRPRLEGGQGRVGEGRQPGREGGPGLAQPDGVFGAEVITISSASVSERTPPNRSLTVAAPLLQRDLLRLLVVGEQVPEPRPANEHAELPLVVLVR